MEAVELFLAGVVAQYAEVLPLWFVGILLFIGSCHVVIPPIQAAVLAVVTATATKKDDEIYAEVIQSKYYIYFVRFVKWTSGLDLSKAKKK